MLQALWQYHLGSRRQQRVDIWSCSLSRGTTWRATISGICCSEFKSCIAVSCYIPTVRFSALLAGCQSGSSPIGQLACQRGPRLAWEVTRVVITLRSRKPWVCNDATFFSISFLCLICPICPMFIFQAHQMVHMFTLAASLLHLAAGRMVVPRWPQQKQRPLVRASPSYMSGSKLPLTAADEIWSK